MSRALVTLIQQSNRILDAVAPKVKEEANKKIAEIEQKIPTKESVRQMMMDEITSKGPELVCSIEVRNRIDFIYDKLKSKSIKLQFILDKSNEKLLKLQEQLIKINSIIASIELIIDTLKALIPVLQTIAITAKVGLIFLKGPAADVDAGIKLKDQIDKSNNKQKEINNSVKVFEKKIAKITEKALIPMKVITLALVAINTIKGLITVVISLIEAFYLKYILMCDVEGDSMEDEDYADAVNNAPDEADLTFDLNFNFTEDELLPGTIEKIRNANFQVIRYRIA